MSINISIYFEGGGKGDASSMSAMRQGMSRFLLSGIGEVRGKARWKVIPCAGRTQTYNAFINALETDAATINILLVDSEDPVKFTNDPRPWEHLTKRIGDQWKQPRGVDHDRCQLMVACMEAWFLADPAGLKKHYGGNLDTAKLPAANLAESRTRADINDALQKATKNTKAKEYQKIRDGAKLLEKVNSAEVRKHCKWCERLFMDLGKAIGAKI